MDPAQRTDRRLAERAGRRVHVGVDGALPSLVGTEGGGEGFQAEAVITWGGDPVDGWTFDWDRNAVVFNGDAIPPNNATIEISYPYEGGC